MSNNVSHLIRNVTRSPVPDLIYEDYRDSRIQEINKHFRSPMADLPSRWHRITLFTTYRCNLNCVYCKTIRITPGVPYPAKSKELDLDGFQHILEMLSQRPVQHIHFTGGEATLVQELPAMVELARERGILCSITSNGMADPDIYERLVIAGINEIRISLDSHEPAEFDRIVRYPKAYERVVMTLKLLASLRNKHRHHPFVIINMCIGNQNRHRLPEFIKQSLLLKPDDIKLITIVQERLTLGHFPEKQNIIEDVYRTLEQFPPSAFPLLRYKLKTVFSSEGLGLKELTSRQLIKNCFIPLTERTLDTTYYYPCSVYLREGGVPLGRLNEDDLETQQKKILHFIQNSNCLEDPICREYCINCCQKFNQFANLRIHQSAFTGEGSIVPIQNEIVLKEKIDPQEVETTIDVIHQDLASAICSDDKKPFLVIKPLGVRYKSRIYEILQAKKVLLEEERTIPNWNQTALRIYCVPPSEENVRRGLMIEGAFQNRLGSTASLLILQNNMSAMRLKELKTYINEMFLPCYYVIEQGNDLAVTLLNFIHTPDQETWAQEYAILMKYSVCT
jgi:wyosine [tRNA(Phe)-imidazoG37] synthetase (radical SAM superfamily)